jgi:hypothetical protein
VDRTARTSGGPIPAESANRGRRGFDGLTRFASASREACGLIVEASPFEIADSIGAVAALTG